VTALQLVQLELVPLFAQPFAQAIHAPFTKEKLGRQAVATVGEVHVLAFDPQAAHRPAVM